jgi:hypothetical protein
LLWARALGRADVVVDSHQQETTYRTCGCASRSTGRSGGGRDVVAQAEKGTTGWTAAARGLAAGGRRVAGVDHGDFCRLAGGEGCAGD